MCARSRCLAKRVGIKSSIASRRPPVSSSVTRTHKDKRLNWFGRPIRVLPQLPLTATYESLRRSRDSNTKAPPRARRLVHLLVENAVDSNNKALQQLFTRASLCESMSVFSAAATMVQRKKRGQSSRRRNSTADAKWNYSSPKPGLATGQKKKRTPKHTRRVTFDGGGDARCRAAGATNIFVHASIDSSSSSSSPTNSYCSCCESGDLSSVTTSFSSSSESLSATESTSLETAFRMYGLLQVPPTFKHLSELSPNSSS
ncbi:hypothetical protein SprV_0301120200 [Sparganum proliferum]